MTPNTEQQNPDNRLRLKGWFWAGKYGPERYLYSLHRVTGVSILIYLVFHIFVTATRVRGQEAWDATLAYLDHPLFRFGELLVFLAFAFHAFNGVRLLVGELGLLLGKPVKPTYPYAMAHRRLRPLMLTLMILAAVVAIVGAGDILFLSRH